MNSEELRRALAETQTPVCVSFSGGKDALAAWGAMREAGVNVVGAYYCYTVPGLSFVDAHLKRCEDAFKMPILQIPHPSTIRMLRCGVFQPPDRYDVAASFPNWTQEKLDTFVKQHFKANLIALGCRVQDNLVRRGAVVKYGAQFNTKRGTAWPVFDWLISDVIDCIRRNGLRLPVDYRMFGRTFDGIHYQYLAPLKEYYPHDYRKVLEWFPLAAAEFTRRGQEG